MNVDVSAIEKELHDWFFITYFNNWVGVGSGEIDEGPEFILKYWGMPLFVTADEPSMSGWLHEGQQVVDFLVMQHKELKANGYTHTHVPEQIIKVYNQNGGAIEVIWSRRAADETEIQRFAAHFEVGRTDEGWKVFSIQARNTKVEKDNDTLDGAWS
ncbi:hypothetical protein [Flagellimonas sp. CMM7]|uniref:DUF6841 family protein n=1 Tax=Flagellimonas sp. CMM7 TaxID=2654676 RepID=UPI0013D627F2|nr:hypothetical protein [Flagellimonas sp. CMM7]UII78773.1 hypothetical protein LV704_14015 [Flagellimonas sp. CMM7]